MDFKMEMTMEIKVTVIHAIGGAIVGYVSSMLSSNLITVLFAAACVFGMMTATQWIFGLKPTEEKGVKKYDKKWFLSNAIWPYLLFWLLVWVLFYNL